jgi:hypothetical protein
MIASLVITLVLLLTILIQDVVSRSIWWFLPPLLFGAIVWWRFDSILWISIAFNIAFIVLLMTLLTGYIRLRWGKLQHPFKEHFGWGDLLFILAITPLLPFPHFVYYFTAGTFLTLIIHLIATAFRKQATIPYAGYFSLVTLIYLILLQCGIDVFQQMTHNAGLG